MFLKRNMSFSMLNSTLVQYTSQQKENIVFLIHYKESKNPVFHRLWILLENLVFSQTILTNEWIKHIRFLSQLGYKNCENVSWVCLMSRACGRMKLDPQVDINVLCACNKISVSQLCHRFKPFHRSNKLSIFVCSTCLVRTCNIKNKQSLLL